MSVLDFKHLKAVVTLAEERHFSRAAIRLRIGQSGLTKQIVAVETFLGFALFIREPKRVTVTEAGAVFVAEARLALQHFDRAINLSRASSTHSALTIHVGRSPYTDPYLITKLLSLRLPLYPNLEIQLTNKLPTDLTQDLLDGSVDLAFFLGGEKSGRLSGTLLSSQPFYVAMLDSDELAQYSELEGQELQARSCILFERQAQPGLYETLVSTVRPASMTGCCLRHTMTAEDALQMILHGLGVAILPRSEAWRIQRHNVTIRPLQADGVRVETRLAARSDNRSRILSDCVRGLVRSLSERPPAEQFSLSLEAL